MTKQFANVEWDLANEKGGIGTWDMVQIAVLMDIRRELRSLNRLLNCHNVTGGFKALSAINRRMAKFDALKLSKSK